MKTAAAPGAEPSPATAPAPAADLEALVQFEPAVAERQADLDRGVERAGLTRDPYRHVMEALRDTLGVLPPLARLLARRPTAVSPAQWAEVREDLARVWREELRTMLPRLVLAAHALRWALTVLAIVAAAGAGYWAGASRPLLTEVGPMPREAADALRATDLTAAWRVCTPLPGMVGQEWCNMPVRRAPARPPG